MDLSILKLDKNECLPTFTKLFLSLSLYLPAHLWSGMRNIRQWIGVANVEDT